MIDRATLFYMTTTWSKIVSFFTEGSANKFLKISLVSFALYATGWTVLEFFVRGPYMDWWVSSRCSDLLIERTANLSCLDGLEHIFRVPNTIFLIVYIIATVAGFIAMYKAIKTHHKWWAAITIYAVMQASPLFLGPFTS